MEDSIRELDDLLHHEGSSSSTTEAYDSWDDDLLGSLIDEFELLPDSAVAASAADEAAVVPRLTTHLGHHHHEIEEGPRTTDERELDDEEDLITEFFNHIGGEDDENPNQDHVHQATEPDHTTLLITIIPFPPVQIIILPVVVGNIGRPRASKRSRRKRTLHGVYMPFVNQVVKLLASALVFILLVEFKNSDEHDIVVVANSSTQFFTVCFDLYISFHE
ncbi:hypothetical protein ACFX2I_031787 [Malus domestica]